MMPLGKITVTDGQIRFLTEYGLNKQVFIREIGIKRGLCHPGNACNFISRDIEAFLEKQASCGLQYRLLL